MTYRNCKKLIENRIKADGQLEAEWAADMLDKLDVFLLASRISDEQYQELTALIRDHLPAQEA